MTDAVTLEPGAEVQIGNITLLAESARTIELRRVLARALGWSGPAEMVDAALRAIRTAATRNLPLSLVGDNDLITTARAVHRVVRGSERPFLTCDPRRGRETSVRVAQNFTSGEAVFANASGGTVCVWSHRPPRDFDYLLREVASPGAGVQLVMMSLAYSREHHRTIAPIVVPALSTRAGEHERIVQDYLCDALARFNVESDAITAADHAWLLTNATSLAGIEKATLRLVAIRASGTLYHAAAKLGMALTSLKRWTAHHKLY